MNEQATTEPAPAPDCRVEEVSFHGWPAVRLTNGLITAVAVPAIGGRLMAFSLGPHEYLFLNRDLAGRLFTPEEHYGDGSLTAWKNYGGDKTWPAPQGWERADQWPGPPDPVLDSGGYQAEVFQTGETVGLTMVSPPDRRTGLRIHRRASIRRGAARLQLDLTFENVADRPVRWAIWDVTQLDCTRRLPDGTAGPNTDCWLYIPTGAPAAGDRPYRVLFGEENRQWQAEVAPGLMGVHYQGLIGKIGVASPGGWLAFADQAAGYVFGARFPYEAGAEYPDGGASVECWTEGPGAPAPLPYQSVGFLVEAEVLGPLRTLPPGERTSLGIEWVAAHCPGPVVRVGPAGCVHTPLQVSAEGSWALVQGSFGCFELGQLELAWLDAGGQVLDQVALQPTSPLAVAWVECVVPLPAGAVRARLQVRGPDDTTALDEATIQRPGGE